MVSQIRAGTAWRAHSVSSPSRRAADRRSSSSSWTQLRRCLHEDALPAEVRAGGALVLLFGLPVSRITTLRHDDSHTDPDGTSWLQVTHTANAWAAYAQHDWTTYLAARIRPPHNRS